MWQHSQRSSLVEDFWGGFAAMLVVIPSSVAFGIIAYGALGPEYAGRAAMAGLLGAAVLGVVASIVGGTAGLISTPCAPAAAVLSATVAGLLSGISGAPVPASNIPVMIALVGLFSACLQTLYGLIGGGRLIKFIPYQVVTGFLSSVGVIIVLGQLPKVLGLPKDVSLWQGLISPTLWKWQGVVVGFVAALAMLLAPKVTRRLPGVVFGLFGGALAYFCLSLISPDLLETHNNSLLIGPLQADGSLFDAITSQVSALREINFSTLKLIAVPSLALSVLLSIDTLKTCVTLDVLTRTRHNSNRELVGQGCGNLASFLLGGLPGAGSMGPTLINLTSGGRTPRAGIIEGVLVLLALLMLGGLIAWIPIAALAGILLVIASRMIDGRIFRLLLTKSGRLDFAVIAGVVTAALSMDLIVAAGLGIAMAILLFIRDQVKGSVIRRKRYLNERSSKTERSEEERTILRSFGDQGVVCELQDNLFFGTTDGLFTQLETDLRTKRFILMDMRRVRSIDYTALNMLDEMHQILAERHGQLLFSAMPAGVLEGRDFETYLKVTGLIGDKGMKIWDTMDSAMEWMEEQILATHGATVEQKKKLLELEDFDLFREFSEEGLLKIKECVLEASLKREEKLFSTGASGDEMFLVRRGGVRIMLPIEGGKYRHLATVSQGGFFGELAFIDKERRSADVEAKWDTDLYVLSRRRFNECSRADAAIGVLVFARLANAIALRLRDTNLRIE
jgi:sulfate permease, SulP family